MDSRRIGSHPRIRFSLAALYSLSHFLSVKYWTVRKKKEAILLIKGKCEMAFVGWSEFTSCSWLRVQVAREGVEWQLRWTSRSRWRMWTLLSEGCCWSAWMCPVFLLLAKKRSESSHCYDCCSLSVHQAPPRLDNDLEVTSRDNCSFNRCEEHNISESVPCFNSSWHVRLSSACPLRCKH